MAKITVNVDTETDLMEVLVDGTLLANVQSVNFYLYEDYYRTGEWELSTQIIQSEVNKESGVNTTTILTAKDCEQGKQALNAGAKLNKKHRDFVETKGSDKFKTDIQSFFKSLV